MARSSSYATRTGMSACSRRWCRKPGRQADGSGWRRLKRPTPQDVGGRGELPQPGRRQPAGAAVLEPGAVLPSACGDTIGPLPAPCPIRNNMIAPHPASSTATRTTCGGRWSTSSRPRRGPASFDFFVQPHDRCHVRADR